MLSKKLISTCCLSLALVSIVPFTAPTMAFAADSPQMHSSKVSKADDEKLTNSLIQKANPFIKVKNKSFCLSADSTRKLTKDEKAIVLEQIAETNKVLASMPNVKLNDDGDTFRISASQNQVPNLSLGLKSNNLYQRNAHSQVSDFGGSSYCYVDFTWWGAKVYFSSKAISDLNDYFSITGYAVELGAGKAVGKFLAKKGIQLTGKYLGPINLAGSAIAYSMSKVDQGRGVFLNCVLYVPATITAL